MNCHRCKKETDRFKMSWFNTDMICPACQSEEKHHSQYAFAKKQVEAQEQEGNRNYEGIGLPHDLKEKYK